MAPTRRHNKTPVIPLMPTAEEKEFKPEFVKHTRSTTDANGVGETVEERIPKIGDETTVRQLLSFLTTFGQARATLSWTTGAKLFHKFRMHLSGIQLTNWEDAIDGMNQNVNNFDAALITNRGSHRPHEPHTQRPQVDPTTPLETAPRRVRANLQIPQGRRQCDSRHLVTSAVGSKHLDRR